MWCGGGEVMVGCWWVVGGVLVGCWWGDGGVMYICTVSFRYKVNKYFIYLTCCPCNRFYLPADFIIHNVTLLRSENK